MIDLRRDTKIDGNQNMIAGRDIILTASDNENYSGKSHFADIDARYCRDVNAEGKLLRGKTEVIFSAEALFTSLVRIGLKYNEAFQQASRAVGILADQKSDAELENWIPSSLDLRSAVMRVLSAQADDGQHNASQVDLWFAAYIRRYGNPGSQYIKVIDNEDQPDLDFSYIKNTILPHVFCRIIGMDRMVNPLSEYPSVFSRTTIDQMAESVIDYTKTLNLYTIRYKTLINLLQDLILEPPHPWIVNPSTKQIIVSYNLERAEAHFLDIGKNSPLYRFEYSVRECFQHSCAAILATYGAFLGVGAKYGLHELRRALRQQYQNPELWHFCQVSKMTGDFKSVRNDIYDFARLLDRINDLLASTTQSDRRIRLYEYAEKLLNISKILLAKNG